MYSGSADGVVSVRPAGAQGFEAFLTKSLLVGLLVSCSVYRLHFKVGKAPDYDAILYFDLPLLALLAFLATGQRLLDGSRLQVRLGVFFPLFLLLSWWFFTGFLRAREPDLFVVSFLQYLAGYLVILAAPRLLLKHGLVTFAMNAFLWCAALVALIGFATLAVDPDRVFTRLVSVLNPNRSHIGLYMLTAQTIALYRAHRAKDKKWYLLVAFMAFSIILLSGSRSALLGCAIVLAAYYLRRVTFANLVKFMVGAVAIALVFTAIVEERQYGNRGKEKTEQFEVSEDVQVDKSSGRRLLIWLVTWKAIRSSDDVFWGGVGFTNYRWEYDRTLRLPFYTNGAHNVYLHVWLESGLVGLILFLLVFLALLAYALSRRRRDPAMMLLAGMVVGVLFTGITQETLFPNEAQSNYNVLFFFACLLMIMDHQLRHGPKPAGTPDQRRDEAGP